MTNHDAQHTDSDNTINAETAPVATVPGVICYRLSPAGQRAAIAAGLSGARDQRIAPAEIPVDLLPICQISAAGTATLDLSQAWPHADYYLHDGGGHRLGHGTYLHEAPLADPVAAYRARLRAVEAEIAQADAARAAKREANRQKEQTRAEAIIDKVEAHPDRIEWHGDHVACYVTPASGPGLTGAYESVDPAALSPDLAARFVEAARLGDAMRASARDAMRAAEAAKVQVRKDVIAAWVRQHGTPNQQGRYAAGVLPEQEVLDAMADQVFAAVTAVPYTPVSYDECLAALDDYDAHSLPDDAEVSCKTTDLDTLTAAQWDAMEAIRAQLPEGAQLKARRIECGLYDEVRDTDIVRYDILARVQVTPFTFVRRFACPSE